MSEDKKTILLVEDDASLNHIITTKLEKSGVRVLSMTTAESALELLKSKKEKVDFIWLDVLLPGMNGIEFLEILRGDPELKDYPVAVISVSSGPETKDKANKLGAIEFLVKSEFRIDDLTKLIIDRMKGLGK